MSDWRSRAEKVEPVGDWRSRAEPVDNSFLTVPSLGDAIETAARTLDYPGGIARTAIAGALGQAGASDIVPALKGQAPTSAQFMERAGVPTGDVVNYPLIGPVSTRGLGGFALDVATDPLTLASKLSRYFNPVSDLSQAAGKTMYKSGLKKIDQKLAEKGNIPVSDILLGEGIGGTTKQIQKKSVSLMNKTGAERGTLNQVADQSGAMVDPNKAFAGAQEQVNKLSRDPGLKDMAERLQEKLNAYREAGPVPVSQATEWKTNLYNSLPENAFDRFGKVKAPAQRVSKAMSQGLRSEIISAADTASPGLGSQIDKVNEKWGSLISAQKPFKAQISRATTPNVVSSIDAIIGGSGVMSGHPQVGAAILAAKKLGDLSKTTAFRTQTGRALNALGQSQVLDPLLRRTFINEVSPWEQMRSEQR